MKNNNSQKNVKNVYISSLTSKKWYKPFCVALTILTLILFFGVSFFIGYGVRGLNNKQSRVQTVYADDSQPYYVFDTSLRSLGSLAYCVYSPVNGAGSDNGLNLFTNIRFTISDKGCSIALVYTNRVVSSSSNYLTDSVSSSEFVSNMFITPNFSKGYSAMFTNSSSPEFYTNSVSNYHSYLCLNYSISNLPAFAFGDSSSSFPLFSSSCVILEKQNNPLSTFFCYNSNVGGEYALDTDSFDYVLRLNYYFNSNRDSYISFDFPYRVSSAFNVSNDVIPINTHFNVIYSSSATDTSVSYQEGYDIGYNKGYEVGYQQKGTSEYNNGYNVGYNKGLNASLSDISPFSALVSGIDSFMQIKIFGSSVTLGLILSLSFGLVLLGIALKVFFHA